MTDAFHEQIAQADAPADPLSPRLRRFSAIVTAILFLLCNVVILLGVWASGMNLDGLFRTPDIFSASRDICLRHSWHKVSGMQQPVQLCYEWINLSDPSGNTHTFPPETDVVLGADGKLHYEHGERVDARLFILLAFISVVLALGVACKRFLIARYGRRLEETNRSNPI